MFESVTRNLQVPHYDDAVEITLEHKPSGIRRDEAELNHRDKYGGSGVVVGEITYFVALGDACGACQSYHAI